MIGRRIVHVRNLPIVSAKGPAVRCVRTRCHSRHRHTAVTLEQILAEPHRCLLGVWLVQLGYWGGVTAGDFHFGAPTHPARDGSVRT